MSEFDKGYTDAKDSFMIDYRYGRVMEEYLRLPNSEYKLGWKRFLSNHDGELGRVMVNKVIEGVRI